MISVGEMLKELETGKICSLVVVTFDRKRKKGGEVVEYSEAKLIQTIVQEEKGKRTMTKMEAYEAQLAAPIATKKARHNEWYTRNIRLCQEGFPTAIIRKIHPPLVILFNGQTVTP